MTGENTDTSILLVDDHGLFRDGLRRILEAHDDLTVVDEAGDSHTAVLKAAEWQPDVVLLDVEIPGDDVSTTIRRLRDVATQCEIVILSMYEGPDLLRDVLRLGIRGYLSKSATWQQLVAAVRGVRTGGNAVFLAVSSDSLAQPPEPATVALSRREREIVRLTAEAMTNGQIARRLQLSEATVKRHLRNIFAKLGAVSRIDAVNRAVAAELIPPPASYEGSSRGSRRAPPARDGFATPPG